MISLMWYDVLMAALLLFFALRGAIKGVIFQLASIAGIVLCFMFANGISQAAGPYVHLEPPLNHWVVLAGAYLGFTLIAFMVARVLNDWISKHKLKEFDRHLGAVLGLVKGIALAMILTFFVVTMSQDARSALKNSYSGRYTAIIMDRLHPILPEKLHAAVADYIHLLDNPDLDLRYTHDGNSAPAGVDATLGQPAALPSGSAPASPSFWSQIQQAFSSEAQRVIADALQSTDPAARARIEQNLKLVLQSIPQQERAILQQQIMQVGSAQLEQFLAWRLNSIPPPSASASPAAPVPAPAAAASQQTALIKEIAGVYSSIPVIRQNIEQDITQRVAGVPDAVSLAALLDWRSDLLGHQPDPDPQTASETAVELRIIRQLQQAGIRIEQLSTALQQRLRAAQAQASQFGSPL